jgi:hypothetical protein
MKLWFYRGKKPNFGDELNQYMWPKIFGEDFFDDDDREIFLGTGSSIFNTHPQQALKVVLGAGYAGYTDPPDVKDGSWDVVAVRGPRTAEKLALPKELAITDSAILIRTVQRPAPMSGGKVAFMPHFQSLERGRWRRACALAGIPLLDPTAPTEETLARLAGLEMLITEAMHGAIVADALRVPWVAAGSLHPSHRDKWADWAESLRIELRMQALAPSSFLEERLANGQPIRGPVRHILATDALAPVLDGRRLEGAAQRLQALARAEPQLSRDAEIHRAVERFQEAVERVRSRYGRPVSAERSRAAR